VRERQLEGSNWKEGELACGGMTPDKIADLVGLSGRAVRSWLRKRWPIDAPGQGRRWDLNHDQIVETLRHFGGPAL